jgi:hypothetical protein
VLELLEDRTVLSTLTVLNALDSGAGSLRDAIRNARSGDTIQFDSGLTGQTITLTSGELAITKHMDIEGPGPDKLAISGNNQSRVFEVSQNQQPVAVTIAGLTIENGFSTSGLGGGILNVSSSLTLTNDVLSNNIVSGKTGPDHSASGGAIENGLGTLTISGCMFVGNQALASDVGQAFGGAIYSIARATVAVSDSTFTGNLARGGSGGNTPNGYNNSGLALGGAIMNDAGSTLSLSGSTFTGNMAIGGSNIVGQSSGRNVASGGGGGLFDSGVATVANCTFTGNMALGGSGNTAGSGVVRVGDGVGGGIATAMVGAGAPAGSAAQNLTVTGCTFTDNEAVGGAGNTGGVTTGAGIGGGLQTNFGSTVTVSNSGFSGNQAVGSDGVAGQSGGAGLGGGITNLGGSSLTVSGCTLSVNSATGGAGGAGQNGGDGLGGGLYNDATSTLTVTQSIVTGNYANGGAAGGGGSDGQGIGGGAYFADGGIVCLDLFTVSNVAGNTASTKNNDIFGSYTTC